MSNEIFPKSKINKDFFDNHRMYAVFSYEVYSDKAFSDQANLKIPSEWKFLTDSLTLKKNGGFKLDKDFFCRAFKSEESKKIIIAFRGSDSPKDWINSNYEIAKGYIPSNSYFSAKTFVSYIMNKNENSNYNIYFTGHSLGGVIAQLMSATFDKESIVFESPGTKKIIDRYYNDSEYSINCTSKILEKKIISYNAAPNSINMAIGPNVGQVIRLFPEFNLRELFDVQQHRMQGLLDQFGNGDVPKMYAMDDNYWTVNEQKVNWPFYEVDPTWDFFPLPFLADTHSTVKNFFNSLAQNTYVLEAKFIVGQFAGASTSVKYFFNSYAQNPYYLEAKFILEHIDSSRETYLNGLSDNQIGSDQINMRGLSITGDDSGNKFFSGTNYADYMQGGSGNDHYYSFSGMNVIKDSGGENTYHFYTFNMLGTTEIIDQNKTGNILIENLNCNISKAYKLTGYNDFYIFFPQFSDFYNPKSISFKKTNYQNDIFFLKKEKGDLLISYNSDEFDKNPGNKIFIRNFNDNDFGINLLDDHAFNIYIESHKDKDKESLCGFSQDSVLVSPRSYSSYLIPINSNFSCSIILTSHKEGLSHNTLEFFKNNENPSTSSGLIRVYGFKKNDVLNVTNIGFTDFSKLSYKYYDNKIVIRFYESASIIELYTSNSFLVKSSNNKVAQYNQKVFQVQDWDSCFGVNCNFANQKAFQVQDWDSCLGVDCDFANQTSFIEL